ERLVAVTHEHDASRLDDPLDHRPGSGLLGNPSHERELYASKNSRHSWVMTAAPERSTTPAAHTRATADGRDTNSASAASSSPPPLDAHDSPHPTRHREAEDRSRRIGRALKHIAGVDQLDEELMDRLGRGYFDKDEAGAAIARAMRKRSGEPGAVSRRQL